MSMISRWRNCGRRSASSTARAQAQLGCPTIDAPWARRSQKTRTGARHRASRTLRASKRVRPTPESWHVRRFIRPCSRGTVAAAGYGELYPTPPPSRRTRTHRPRLSLTSGPLSLTRIETPWRRHIAAARRPNGSDTDRHLGWWRAVGYRGPARVPLGELTRSQRVLGTAPVSPPRVP
jgi:hypothetical protein